MKKWAANHLSEYGMLLVLILLCALFSALTLKKQVPSGKTGGAALAERILAKQGSDAAVFIAVRETAEDGEFLEALRAALEDGGARVAAAVRGDPGDARRELERLAAAGAAIDVIACNQATGNWAVFDGLVSRLPAIGDPPVVMPASYWWPDFLKGGNLLNITGQISIIAIIAIGMTFVIITAGIDLSVGSLVALSAVSAAWSIRALGGKDAGLVAILLACAAAILVCACAGGFTGVMVTAFRVPAFIVTLAIMLIARGVAQLITGSQTIYDVPEGFTWLGREASLLGIPNSAVLMLGLYGLAHVLLSRSSFGRYVYAVGGNSEAARLSGVPVRRVTFSVYVLCGALAGLGGVVLASQLQGGSHTWGRMLELDVIAAVVVGGASLAGGVGKMSGTLIGAFIIAVIGNGMNLLGLEDSWQFVVRGSVILAAVFFDQLKNRTLRGFAG